MSDIDFDQGTEPRGNPWAATVNMTLALETLNEAVHADAGMPRICLFYGPSGYGKTVGAAHAASLTSAAYVLARQVWTQKCLVEAIARELGIRHLGKTTAKMVDQIVDHLEISWKPLIIDEGDYLVRKQFVDILRDIHDSTNSAIMLVGEEALPAKLKEWERFDNRILVSTPAQPTSIADGRLLRDLYARRVTIADDLIDHFVGRCKGITRRIVANINKAQRIAVEEYSDMRIDLRRWGERPVITGELQPRKGR